MRGERLPGGGDFLFWQKRKSPKKVALGVGDELNALSGHRFAGPLGFVLATGGDAGVWLVLPLVRQQLHALLSRSRASTVLALSCSFFRSQ